MATKAGMSAIDKLRRVVSVCGSETEQIVQELPSVSAVVEYVELLDELGVEDWNSVLEEVQSQSADSASAEMLARAFIRKHRLPRLWTKSLETAIAIREES